MKKWILTFDKGTPLEGHDAGDVSPQIAANLTYEQLEDRIIKFANDLQEPIEIEETHPRILVAFISCSDQLKDALSAENYVRGIKPR